MPPRSPSIFYIYLYVTKYGMISDLFYYLLFFREKTIEFLLKISPDAMHSIHSFIPKSSVSFLEIGANQVKL